MAKAHDKKKQQEASKEIVDQKILNLWEGLERKFGDLHGRMAINVRPAMTAERIGGLTEAKREIEGFSYVVRKPDLQKAWGIEPSKGLLLYGPVGSGKTMLAEYLASISDATLFRTNLPNFLLYVLNLGPRIGELVTEFFSVVQECERAVVYFEHLDYLSSESLSFLKTSGPLNVQLFTFILQLIDRLAQLPHTLIVASTNHPRQLRSQLLQRGRFERIVEVPLPDRAAQKEIFEIHRQAAEKRADRKLFGKIARDRILQNARDLSGAEIKEWIRRTLEDKARKEGCGKGRSAVTTEDLLRELETFKRIRGLEQKIKVGQSLYL